MCGWSVTELNVWKRSNVVEAAFHFGISYIIGEGLDEYPLIFPSTWMGTAGEHWNLKEGSSCSQFHLSSPGSLLPHAADMLLHGTFPKKRLENMWIEMNEVWQMAPDLMVMILVIKHNVWQSTKKTISVSQNNFPPTTNGFQKLVRICRIGRMIWFLWRSKYLQSWVHQNSQIWQTIRGVRLTLRAVDCVGNVDILTGVFWYWFKGIHAYIWNANTQICKVSYYHFACLQPSATVHLVSKGDCGVGLERHIPTHAIQTHANIERYIATTIER